MIMLPLHVAFCAMLCFSPHTRHASKIIHNNIENSYAACPDAAMLFDAIVVCHARALFSRLMIAPRRAGAAMMLIAAALRR